MTGRTATHGQPIDDARTRVAEAVPTDPRDASMGLGRRLITSIREDDVSGLGAEMAYRFLFAVFPFGLFVAALSSTVAGWLRLESPANQIIAGLGDNLPPAVAEAVQPDSCGLVRFLRCGPPPAVPTRW